MLVLCNQTTFFSFCVWVLEKKTPTCPSSSNTHAQKEKKQSGYAEDARYYKQLCRSEPVTFSKRKLFIYGRLNRDIRMFGTARDSLSGVAQWLSTTGVHYLSPLTIVDE